MDIAVDPASPGDGQHDTVLYGCQNAFRSTDSGATFGSINVGHADVHTWTCVPQPTGTNTVVYCGSDGGIDVSTNGGSAWSPKNKGGLQTGLFYNIAIKPDATASVTVGALQDNQVETTAPPAVSPEWIAGTGGDGWDVAYDGSSPPVLYATSGGPNTVVGKSTDDGVTFPSTLTPPWNPSVDTGGFLLNQIAADPSASGILYVSGSQNLWQRQASGTWRIIATLGSTGNVDVAPANGNHVVIGAGSQVYVSTNALATTVGGPTGVTFSNITANLPGRNVTRAVFDPIDPNLIYAVLDGFPTIRRPGRTCSGPRSAPARGPTSHRCLTSVRSNRRRRDDHAHDALCRNRLRRPPLDRPWRLLVDPRRDPFPQGASVRPCIRRTGRRAAGRYLWPRRIRVREARRPGDRGGTPGRTRLRHRLRRAELPDSDRLQCRRSDLVITNVERLFGSTDFTVLPTPATPLTISPGEDVEFTISFTPTTAGVTETATIRIISNDPTAVVDLAVTALQGTGAIATAIADSGNFGDVCLGSFADKPLTINNSGDCTLSISNISGSAAPSRQALSLPPQGRSWRFDRCADPVPADRIRSTRRHDHHLQQRPGGTRVRSRLGRRADAEGEPDDRRQRELRPAGSLVRRRALIITNSGKCTLTITGISSSSPEFLVPQVLAYPITVGPGDALPAPIRFPARQLRAEVGDDRQ